MSAPVQPDIYADKPEITLAYQVAVMQAALEGKPVQILCNNPRHWGDLACPAWNWNACQYRIDPASRPRLAVGHNPAGLTEEQVGVKEGWRLLTEEELSQKHSRDDVGVWVTATGHWVHPSSGNVCSRAYRTKQPPGHFLPRKTRVPLVSDDLPSPCWIRFATEGTHHLVAAIAPYAGVRIASAPSEPARDFSMARLEELKAHHSQDRKTWLPCWREV